MKKCKLNLSLHLKNLGDKVLQGIEETRIVKIEMVVRVLFYHLSTL